MENDIFYNYNKILSYNALVNMLIGEAGVGKTFGCTKFLIERFKNHDEQFAYIRRYKKEVTSAVPKFFNAMKNKNVFPNDLLYNKGRTFYCNDLECGYAMELSTAQDLKGSEFSKVKNILFDEFIIEKGQKKYYLQNEVNTFLRLLETLGRLRDIRVFMLGNAADIINPYFLYFDLHLPYNNDIALFKNNTILLQYMKNEKYRETKKATRFGKLIEGTDYENYAVNNNFFNNNKDFIEKKYGTSKFSFAFIYNEEIFGVWFDYSLGKVFVSYDYIKNTPYMFSTTLKDHTPNTLLLTSIKKYNCWKGFIEAYKLGNVRFENMKIKNICQDLIRIILR